MLKKTPGRISCRTRVKCNTLSVYSFSCGKTVPLVSLAHVVQLVDKFLVGLRPLHHGDKLLGSVGRIAA